MGDGTETGLDDAETAALYAALGRCDEHIREVRFVARGEGTVATLLAARLRGWPPHAVTAALVESAALGGEGDGARALGPGDAVCLLHRVREPRVPVRWTVVYEDEHLVVVDKGPGFPVHPAGAFVERTLLRSLRAAGYEGVRPAHRLDRETSGLVVLARDGETLSALQAAWQRGEVGKRYLAVVAPAPRWESRVIDLPVGPAPGPEAVRQGVGPGGRPARTEMTVLRRGQGEPGLGEAALVACTPTTGRQHQLRVHLAAAGCPLVGDKLYRGDGATYLRVAKGLATEAEVRALGHPRHALHAAELLLPGPPPLHLEAPLPPDLLSLLARLGL